ncbi:phosphoribosyl 1,2-cyclic phosphate phosphodiesterase [Paracoccus isoporae]|uniref:Phosphoribosyl 1,2-cyclic phosphate phosphodiesterase n=1 Tax=Paracoccus isoporae TaxID=591205 RepID=A0A1G6SR87_9RHOB|nr:MBL fold metallo-hydrolase [Paracoccus isoporae]SDD19131.1 phosphoribosyl 1,2-cyclic phosphate phosphodiesterase [Paracoccus isoporae]
MIRVTILGCGSSGGVPRIGGNWGACDPGEPRNRRRRCSILIERIGDAGRTVVLVDTGPDLVPQLLDTDVRTLDAVVWTHAHADHIHGIDDLRQLAYNARARVQGFADAPTTRALMDRFGYIFQSPPGSQYPPICDLHPLDGPIRIDGAGGPVALTPFTVPHGAITALGLRIGTAGGGIIYLPDVQHIPDEAWEVIGQPEIFVCDALRHDPHPSHAHLSLAVEWILSAGAKRGVLTNMHIDLDYALTDAETPSHITPAHDGMVIEAQP